MAKIPDERNFGGRPTPRATRGVPNAQRAASGFQQAADIQSRSASQPGVAAIGAEVAEAFVQADVVRRTRLDTVARARAAAGYNDTIAEQFRTLQSEGDLSDPEVAAGFIRDIRDQAAKAVAEHGGSEDSKARLAERLEGIRSHFANNAATARMEAEQALIQSNVNTSLRSITAEAYNSPGQLANLYESLDGVIDDMAPALTPGQELELRNNGRAEIAASAVESLIASGALSDARRLLQDVPGVIDVLTPAKQRELMNTIVSAERAQREDALARMEVQSPEGKVIMDREKLVSLYGMDSPQVQAFEELAMSPNEVSLSDEAGQRKEFTKLSGVFVDTRDSYNRIRVSSEDPSPAGDLSLMFNYMKMLDPASVVRESEFAQVAATGSFGTRLQAAATRFLEGERLTDAQRLDFVRRAEELMLEQASTQAQLEQSFRAIAIRSGLNPDNVVVDFMGSHRPTGNVSPTSSEVPEIRMDLEGNIIQ